MNATANVPSANIIGVPPSYPPRKVNGLCVGCFLTPDTTKDNYTHPPAAKDEIASLTGEYPVDVKGFRTERKDWLKEEIYTMSRKHFEVVRHYLRNSEWDYFQFVEIGLDRLQLLPQKILTLRTVDVGPSLRVDLLLDG